MKVKEIYDFIDSFAPFSTQCEWDNSGLLIGNPDNEIIKIGLSLDADISVIKEAAEKGCNLIITHHPVIFRPLKSISDEDPVTALIRNNINIICAHTNLDKSTEGVNFVLANTLGLKNIRRFETDTEANMCLIGDIEETNATEFSRIVSEKLCATVEFTDAGKTIRTVAGCGGAGGEFIYELQNKVDAFVSGEFSYHEFLDSKRLGISAIRAGHFETENPVISYLHDKIKNYFNIECVLLNHKNPANYIGVNNAT